MVGTIEPRKGHSLVLDEFEKVWALGIKVQLNIIGRVGWNSEEVIKRIERLIVAGERISWSESTSDLELNQSLAKSHFLVCASTHEGYCLPGLEANAVGLGVIARNIPVYREGLGNFAYFFESDNPDKETALSDVVVAITKGVGDKHKLSDQELGIVSSDKSPETTWRIFLGDSR
jgi:glycosyltransferase involved in cell wall biosynthesis